MLSLSTKSISIKSLFLFYVQILLVIIITESMRVTMYTLANEVVPISYSSSL